MGFISSNLIFDYKKGEQRSFAPNIKLLYIFLMMMKICKHFLRALHFFIFCPTIQGVSDKISKFHLECCKMRLFDGFSYTLQNLL